MSPSPARQRSSGRIEIVDLARFVALVAMTVYHFGWDLEFFGYAPIGMTGHGGWRLLARVTAGSFLFLSGLGLVLAHGEGVCWPAFRRRWVQVAAGALAISVVTAFATPQSFVFFGILHQIAFASLLGLLFLRLPWFLTLAVAALIVALPHVLAFPALDTRWLAWIGLYETSPLSNDFVPVFPWTGAVLAGIVCGRLFGHLGLWERLRRLNPGLRPLAPLATVGRHTLLYYLLHQPVLIACVWLATQIAPPDLAAQFPDLCMRQCTAANERAVCERFCACEARELSARELMEAALRGSDDADTLAEVDEVNRQCSFEALNPQ